MRAIRTIPFVAVTLAFILGTSVVAVSAAADEMTPTVRGVVGSIELEAPESLGAATVTDGIYQHRDIPVLGFELYSDDARLLGRLDAVLNYDIHLSGAEPVPAWGTLTIDEGAWSGTFTGIRRQDFEPFELQAFLVGSGPYDGLCAVLDIKAGPGSWAIDGVIHPLPMSG